MAFLTNGFQTLIGHSLAPGVLLREREVQPPEIEVGAIDTTTMRNEYWRTQAPKFLITPGDITVQGQYDPILPYGTTTFTGLLGLVGNITIRFPDLSAIVFPGWLDKITPASLKEEEFPLAEFKFKPSMLSPANGGGTRTPATFAGTAFYQAGPVANPN